ncbi:hypothetical protein Tco_1026669, partial [Tanacetum coccineum]
VHPVFSVLQNILNRTFLNLHALDKALLRWDPSGAIRPSSSSDRIRLSYDVKEPQTFGTSLCLDHIEDAEAADKIRILYNLRRSLAVFLSQVGSLSFDKVSDYKELWPDTDDTWDEQWVDINTDDAINLIHENLNKLDMYISMVLTDVRDEYLETIRNRQMREKIEQVQSTSNELRSMLLDFSERIQGKKSPSNVLDHEMLEMATT